MDGWDGWMNGWTDGRTDGRTDLGLARARMIEHILILFGI
jgi:hypothetical protein